MKLITAPIVFVISVSALSGCATLAQPVTSPSATQPAISEKPSCAPKRHIGIKKCPGPSLFEMAQKSSAPRWRI